jgi:Ca2+-dependent lipid-binding protein
MAIHGLLLLTVVEARFEEDVGFEAGVDNYVEIEYRKERHRTRVISNEKEDLVFDQKFYYKVHSLDDIMIVRLFN